jgi:glycosyltransferase involved in cell wall biosynthesis
MVLAEALAHGLPVVSTTAGAIPDTVPASAGLLVPPGDVEALSQAIETAVVDSGLRAALAAGAVAAAAGLPDWDDSARRFEAALLRASSCDRVLQRHAR